MLCNEHVIDYVDMVRLGDVRCELAAHVQAYHERQEELRRLDFDDEYEDDTDPLVHPWSAAMREWYQL